MTCKIGESTAAGIINFDSFAVEVVGNGGLSTVSLTDRNGRVRILNRIVVLDQRALRGVTWNTRFSDIDFH